MFLAGGGFLTFSYHLWDPEPLGQEAPKWKEAALWWSDQACQKLTKGGRVAVSESQLAPLLAFKIN